MKTVLFPQFENNTHVTSSVNKPIMIVSRETGVVVGMIVHNMDDGKWFASCGFGGFVGRHKSLNDVMRQLGNKDYYYLVDIKMPIREEDMDVAKVSIKLATGDIIYPGSKNWTKNHKYDCIINDKYMSSDRVKVNILDSAIIDREEYLLIYKKFNVDKDFNFNSLDVNGKIDELVTNKITCTDDLLLLTKVIGEKGEDIFYNETKSAKYHFTYKITD